MSYNPREYWPARLKREGALYVSTKRSKKVNDHQWEVFRDSLFRVAPGRLGRVLDFGCGVGRFAEPMMTIADSYVGVDINEGAFEFAPKRVDVAYAALPGDTIPFGDEEFDTAIAVTVLQHIVDESEFGNWTAEISRVVKPGGNFLIIDDADQRARMAAHMRVRGPEKIAEALGGSVAFDMGTISAERPNSHYCFCVRKDTHAPEV